MAIFEIALRGVERKKLKILSIIILNAIAIIMIGGILYIKDTNTRSEYLTNNILSNGNENTYVMFIYGKMDSKMLTECNIKNIDCAKSDIGGWEMEGVDELVNLQGEIKSNDNNKQTEDFGNYLDNTKRILEVTSIQNIESLELYNLKLQDGKYYSKQEAKDKTVYFYLGSKYKNIKAGTSYKMADGNTAVVAGIFEENQYIIDADGFQGSVSDMLANIDDKILGFENIDDNNLYGRYLVTFNDNMTSKAAIENMKAIAIENNISISACTVKDAFEEIYHKENITLGAFRELVVIVLVSVFFISSCVMILDIQKNQKSYGILCANGASIRNIKEAIILENCIVILLSIAGAVLLTLTQDKTIFRDKIFWEMTFGKIIIFCILLLVITSALPIIFISKMDIKKMLQGDAV